MLVLGRRVGESIFIGDDIEIRIVDISATRIKLGIVAPRQLSILRGEMREAAEQNRAAAQTDSKVTFTRIAAHLRSYANPAHR